MAEFLRNAHARYDMGISGDEHGPGKIGQDDAGVVFQNKEWEMLPERFHVIGLPNFVVLCLATKIFFIKWHLGFEEVVGDMMLQAYEAFLIEVELYGDVLTRDFEKVCCLATDLTWF